MKVTTLEEAKALVKEWTGGVGCAAVLEVCSMMIFDISVIYLTHFL